MAKSFFNLGEALGRLLKIVMVALLVPLSIALLMSAQEQLELIVNMSGSSFWTWVGWGFVTYVGVHLLLARPTALFRASHRVFSAMALWLFGGQVSSVEGAASPKGRGKPSKPEKGDVASPMAQGSTLVAFSPYVIPVYTVLVCGLGWALGRIWDRAYLDGPAGLLIGFTIALHWLMTAEDLQQQRKRWHFETYLLALSLVFIVTILIAAACLPWVMPGFSFVQLLSDGFKQTQQLYTALIQNLFL